MLGRADHLRRCRTLAVALLPRRNPRLAFGQRGLRILTGISDTGH